MAFAAVAVNSQVLPSEIRGYKVHRAKIEVHTIPSSSASSDKTTEAHIKLGRPHLTDVSLTGLSFEVSVEASPVSAAGTIDFLTFQDFRVNGIPVEIDEYPGPIAFKKEEPFSLPHPAKIFVGTGGVLEAAWSEYKSSKNDWVVTGRVFAFGKFRKMGMKFKRVVPIDINVSIKNPFLSDR